MITEGSHSSQNDALTGWADVCLVDVCQVVQGQSPPGETYNNDGLGLPFLQGKAEFGDTYPTAVKWCSAPTKVAEVDDVLISIRAPVGPTNLCPEKSCIGRGLAALRPRSNISPKFVLYSLRSSEQELRTNSTGTTFDAIRGDDLRSHPVPLPPLAEQRRIVAEIETQFTRLDASVAALRRAQANLKRYRASVLKDACEGRLVPSEAELARSEGRWYEPADVLLERIMAERRARWESQEKRRGKYKEPSAPDTSDLPELPEGWVWTTLEPLLSLDRSGIKTGPFGSLLKKHEHRDSGVPVFGIENIREMEFVPGNKIYVTPAKAKELSQFDVKEKDILISRSGTVGEACVVPEGEGDARFSTNIMRLSLLSGYAHPRYFCLLFNGSPEVLEQVSELCGGSTRSFLNGNILRSLVFPLPPLAEQRRIVAEVERRLSVVQQAEATVEASLARAERLRQSILKQAFSGKLVPQDPDDEPASVLLERIKAEREAEAQASSASKGKSQRRGKRKTTA